MCHEASSKLGVDPKPVGNLLIFPSPSAGSHQAFSIVPGRQQTFVSCCTTCKGVTQVESECQSLEKSGKKASSQIKICVGSIPKCDDEFPPKFRSMNLKVGHIKKMKV